MSDHCKSCIEGFEDLVGLTDEESFKKGLAALVLCEGCGPIQVDPWGYCLGKCKPYFHEDTPHVCRNCWPDKKCPFHNEGGVEE